ncbi:MAG: hypothetical protein J0I53_11890 [Chryseobacterium sp.]|nr:hypothetical protein [Chryseobacterium sp.]
MKKLLLLMAAFFMLSTVIVGCQRDKDDDDEEEEVVRNNSSIVPSQFQGRSNVKLGAIYVDTRTLELGVYDHGTIDGDIISLYVNGKLVLDKYTLKGPADIKKVKVTLDYTGYNYILMYAHNEGSIPPNTCTLTVKDASSTKDFVLESNLSSNGAVDVIVD